MFLREASMGMIPEKGQVLGVPIICRFYVDYNNGTEHLTKCLTLEGYCKTVL